MTGTIRSLILNSIKRSLLMVSLAAGLFFIVHSIFSSIRIEQSARNYILAHVTRITVADYNSQNTTEIANRVRQFIETWMMTQDLDVRIEVFISNRLVAQAGQMQPFSFFSTTSEEASVLGSGQPLLVKAQINLLGLATSYLWQLILIQFFIFSFFYWIRLRLSTTISRITDPLVEQIENIQKMANDLSDPNKRDFKVCGSPVHEITMLNDSVLHLLNKIDELEADVKIKTLDEAKAKVAKVVAHNIRGALSTLKMRIDSIPQISEKDHVFLSELLTKIMSAADGVLKPKPERVKEEPQVVELSRLIKQVVLDVKEKYADLDIQYVAGSDFEFAFGSEIELSAIVENLVNNSIDAVKAKGSIRIESVREHEKIFLTVEDNGCGIPNDLLPRLGQEGVTWGKPNGNGLGLYHAFDCVKRWGGAIIIDSKLNQGTRVKIELRTLKVLKMNDKFEINLKRDMKLFIIDDDELVHSSWDIYLSDIPNLRETVKVHHLHSPEEFDSWVKTNGLSEYNNSAYIVDYEFKNSKKNGLDIIEDHGINLEAILNSGLKDDESVNARARYLGVRFALKGSNAIKICLINEGGKEGSICQSISI